MMEISGSLVLLGVGPGNVEDLNPKFERVIVLRLINNSYI